MDSRQLTSLLSSLVSQLTLLILLLFPSNNRSLSPNSDTHSQTLFSLLHHFITTSHTLTHSLRKRTRTHFSESDYDPDPPSGHSKLGRLARVDSVLVKDPDSFRVLFKMSPSTFEWLSGLLEPLLECRDPVNLPMNDLSAELRLGIGLFRLATGSSYDQLADRFRVTDRVAKFCTKQLCRVLCTNFRFWVGFPNPPEIESVCSEFESLTGLPNCCGVIGCTRFMIDCDTDMIEHEQQSVAAQMVVDSTYRILSIVAGFDGNLSNNEILKSSTLCKDIEGGTLLNSQQNIVYIGDVGVPHYLVGDKGYTIQPWLMTPFDEPQEGSNEERFNVVHGLMMKNSMSKTIASLKNWGILSKPIEEDSRDGVAYIGACAILHNALLLREDYSAICGSVDDDLMHGCSLQVSDYNGMEDDLSKGCIIRSSLATKAKGAPRHGESIIFDSIQFSSV